MRKREEEVREERSLMKKAAELSRNRAGCSSGRTVSFIISTSTDDICGNKTRDVATREGSVSYLAKSCKKRGRLKTVIFPVFL